MTSKTTNKLSPEVRSRAVRIVLFIEHDMVLVMRVAQRIVVIDFGPLNAEGTRAEIKVHPEVVAAYRGGTEAEHA